MEDFDFETTARCVARYETLRKAVETRKYTDRPGADWSLSSVAELPEYTFGRNKVMITSTDDGNAFEVLVFSYANGRKLHGKTYKTLDAAFRNGEKFADVDYPKPADKVVEAAPAEVPEVAPIVADEAPAETPQRRVIAEFSTNRGTTDGREDALTLTAPLENSDPFERISTPHVADWSADDLLRTKGWRVIGDWEYFAGSNVHRATVERVEETPVCIHGRAPHADVTGDPIGVCRNMRGVEDFGVFNDEGCLFAHGCAVDVANEAVKESADSDHITWSKVCADHPDEPADTCEECNAEGCGALDTDDLDACGHCPDCTNKS